MSFKDKKKRKDYYQKHKEKIIKCNKQYYQRNKEKILEWKKQYYQKHKERRKKYSKQHYKKKKETIQWQELHRKRLLQKKISDRLRQRISKALIRQSSTKAKRTLFLLGCTIEEFIEWLEKQFTKDMNWVNYGLWEIDHIKSCINFDLTKKSEQQQCFHYTNLRPLWVKDNRSRKKYLT